MGSQGLNEKLCEGQALQAERTPGSQVLKRGPSLILDIQGMQQELVLENNENVIRHHLHTNLQNYIIFKELTRFKTTSISSSDGQKIQKTIPDEVNKNH